MVIFMNLNYEEIKNITFGAVNIREEMGGLAFYKCSDRQYEVVKKHMPDIFGNATNSTGCRMDFHTNSKVFSVDTASGNKFDIYINGVFVRHCEMGETREKIIVELPDGENRVEFIFASHDDVTVINGVELSDGAVFYPHKYSKKMLFCGDSITHGWESHYDSLSYAWRVARFFDADIINQAVGGAVFCPDYAEKLDFDPDVVIIAYGTNDFSRCDSFDEIYDNAFGYIKKMTEFYKNSKIFVISPIWRADEITKIRPFGTFAECRKTVMRAAEQLPVKLIDGYTLTPHITDFYSDGYLHPNSDGFGIYAENLIKEMLSEISL